MYILLFVLNDTLYLFYSYGWAMSQYMPKNGFNWYKEDLSVENILNLLDGMDETSEVGWALEVDVSYPESLHDDHNDLPYLPERITPPGSKIKKLVANLHFKRKYIVHYMALKQALKAGLILEKVIIVFIVYYLIINLFVL
jgi:hypothetical protein